MREVIKVCAIAAPCELLEGHILEFGHTVTERDRTEPPPQKMKKCVMRIRAISGPLG